VNDRSLVERVLARWAAVIPFKPKPGVPTILIHGRKYTLSTHSGSLMGDIEEGFVAEGEGGARLIETPITNKWKYLWVYDTDKQIVAMWRVSDGDEKVHDQARMQGALIVKLEKKGQLNRVTHDEFRRVDTDMGRRTADALSSMQKYIEENKDDFQRQVDIHVRQFFDRMVKPSLERAVSDVRRGVRPFNFKPLEGSQRSIEQQAVMFVVGETLRREMPLPKVEAWLKTKGLDVDSPNVDNQATQWAIGDIWDEVQEQYAV